MQSFLPLIIVVILFFIVGTFAVSKITNVRDQITLSEKQKTVLNQKIKILQNIKNTINEGSSASIDALPESNTSVVALSQIRSLANENNVVVSSLKSTAQSSAESSISTSDMSFDVNGEISQILNFLKSIDNFAPIARLTKVKFSGNQGLLSANVSIQIYWSPLPKIIPQITDATNDLTNDEITILEKIKLLVSPRFSSVPASDTEGKPDPFSQ